MAFASAVTAQTEEERPQSVVAPTVVKPKNQAPVKGRPAPTRVNTRTTQQQQAQNAPSGKNSNTGQNGETSEEESAKKERGRFLKFMAKAADQIVMNAVGITAAIVLVVPTIYAASTILTTSSDP
ncbi:MAG: hypothetical protein ACFB10_15545 [Salibacteraceae bacterium]